MQDELEISKVSNVKITASNEKIVLDSSIINSKTVIDCLIIFTFFFLLINPENFQRVWWLGAIGIIALWLDFRTINYALVDFAERRVTVRSKNALMHFLYKQKTVDFSEIILFEVDYNGSMRQKNYFVSAETKGTYIKICSCSNEEDGNKIAKYLTSQILKK